MRSTRVSRQCCSVARNVSVDHAFGAELVCESACLVGSFVISVRGSRARASVATASWNGLWCATSSASQAVHPGQVERRPETGDRLVALRVGPGRDVCGDPVVGVNGCAAPPPSRPAPAQVDPLTVERKLERVVPAPNRSVSDAAARALSVDERGGLARRSIARSTPAAWSSAAWETTRIMPCSGSSSHVDHRLVVCGKHVVARLLEAGGVRVCLCRTGTRVGHCSLEVEELALECCQVRR